MAEDEEYWRVEERTADSARNMCRECRKYILKGERYILRQGKRIWLCYHIGCYSGATDPRTQDQSSYRTAGLPVCDAPPPRRHKKYW
eukprot:m51a1_g1338 hypothetical protein (87) ;mRNA; r:319192-319556